MKSLEKLNVVQDTTGSESNGKETLDVKIVHSQELDKLSDSIEKLQEAIDTDQNLVAGDLLALKEVVGNIRVNIGGEEFTLEEVKDIENLKVNAEIWQEMEAGNFNNIIYLTLLSKRAKELISNYTGLNLYLSSLTSAKHLTLPQSISGDLYLNRLTSAEHLTLPKSIGGHLNLFSLTSEKDLILPKSIGGTLDLNHLTSAEHLTLPDSIGGSLDLGGITFAKDLKLPDFIGGTLNLSSLKSADHLTLPNSIGSSIYLGSLPPSEIEELKKKYPQHARKINQPDI